MGRVEWSLLGLLSLLWGGSFVFVEVALTALPPLTIVALRVGLAALALFAVLQLRGQRLPRDPASWVAFATMGLLNNVAPFSLIVWGQTEVSAGLAAILNATTPLFAVVLAHLVTTDERMTGARICGVLAGLAGVVWLVGPGVLGGLGANALAQGAVLGAALCYACAGIFGRRFAGRPPLVTACAQVTASAVMLIPVALLVDRPWSLALPAAGVWWSVGALAVASTALAYVIYFHILARSGATNLLLVTFLIPVSAATLGAALLGERLGTRDLVGMLLIGCGLAAIDGRAWGFLRARGGARNRVAPCCPTRR